jgi:hypothetical protein
VIILGAISSQNLMKSISTMPVQTEKSEYWRINHSVKPPKPL